MNVYAKFRCASLHIKKALGIFRELIPTRTTRVGFWDPPSGLFTKNGMSRKTTLYALLQYLAIVLF